MPIIEARNRLEDAKMERLEDPRFEYARLEIDLGDASLVGENIEIAVRGSYLAKISYTGSGVYFKLDNRHAAKIYANEFWTVRRGYERLWLTNPSLQAGKKLILQIGQSETSEVIPDDWGERNNITLESIKDATDIDDSSYLPGEARVMVIGGYAFASAPTDPVDEGDASAVGLTLNREMRVENIPPVMTTDLLAVTGDAASDTVAAPGVGYAIEVMGYQIGETVDAAATISDPAFLKFGAGVWIWCGIMVEPGAVREYHSIATGLRVVGPENTALTLTNADVGAGSTTTVAVVYYRIISV